MILLYSFLLILSFNYNSQFFLIHYSLFIGGQCEKNQYIVGFYTYYNSNHFNILIINPYYFIKLPLNLSLYTYRLS